MQGNAKIFTIYYQITMLDEKSLRVIITSPLSLLITVLAIAFAPTGKSQTMEDRFNDQNAERDRYQRNCKELYELAQYNMYKNDVKGRILLAKNQYKDEMMLISVFPGVLKGCSWEQYDGNGILGTYPGEDIYGRKTDIYVKEEGDYLMKFMEHSTKGIVKFPIGVLRK